MPDKPLTLGATGGAREEPTAHRRAGWPTQPRAASTLRAVRPLGSRLVGSKRTTGPSVMAQSWCRGWTISPLVLC